MGGAASAQTAATVAPRDYDLAPWWMDKPIIASVGYVWTEVQANRATASAVYQVVDKDSAVAMTAAADKVRALGQALEAFGADRVRISTTFSITPLYAQYRDKEGQLNENERADKIERYQVSARDLRAGLVLDFQSELDVAGRRRLRRHQGRIDPLSDPDIADID
eukprot:gene5334-7055_t